MSQNNSSPGIVGYVGANQVAIGSTVSPFVINGVAPGAAGTVLASNGVSSNPSFQALSGLAVTSVTGTANQVTASPTTGAVTLSTPSTFIAPGSIASTTSLTAGNGFTVTTGTSNINGTALFKGPTPWADVVAYGADPTGSASSVAAFNAAIASIPVGGIVWIPVGTYKIDSPITVSTPHIRFCGASRTDCILNNTQVTGNTINLNTFYGGCENLTFTAPANTNTAGFAIGMTTSSDFSYVWRCDIQNMYNGIHLIGNLSYAEDISFATFSNAASGGSCIVVDSGSANIWIRKIKTNNGGTITGFAGIRFINVSAALVSDCQLIGATTAMSIEPTVGLTVPSIEVVNTFFDTSTTGLSVTGAGTPARCKFTNCWFSSQTTAGITFNNANMTGFTFDNCDFYGNGIGIQALAATDWCVMNSRIAGNTTAGIQTTAAAAHSFMILGCTIGPTGVFGANGNGINIQSGTYASYRIRDNIGLQGNTTPGITDSGVVANQNQKDVGNNLGATIKGLISANTAATGAINTAETIVAGGKAVNGATAVIPANSLQIGNVIRVTMHGTCTSTAANVSTFTLRMGTAGTTGDASVATAATSVAATSGTTVGFTATLEFVVLTIGGTGTIAGHMLLLNTGITGISANNTQSINLTSTATLNTTTANYIEVTYKSAATTTTSTFQTAFVEVL
jgi:Pectate lyase superfamily protein